MVTVNCDRVGMFSFSDRSQDICSQVECSQEDSKICSQHYAQKVASKKMSFFISVVSICLVSIFVVESL